MGQSMQRDEKLFGQAGQLIGPSASLNDRHHQGTFFRAASTLPKLVNCRKSSSSCAVGRNRGAGFLTGRKLARLRSECQGLHRAEPGVYSAAAAHEPIFPPGAKADAVALAWVVLEGGG
jgi:hypothetical protein